MFDYRTPVELFASGSEAADHGMASIDAPGEPALDMIAKIVATRQDVRLTL